MPKDNKKIMALLKETQPQLSLINKKTVLHQSCENDLNTRLAKGTDARQWLDEIQYIFNHFETIDDASFIPNVEFGLNTHRPDIKSTHFMDALAYQMIEIEKQYSAKSVFVDAYYNVGVNDDSNNDKEPTLTVLDSHFKINDEALGIYLYNHLYKHTVVKSKSHSETNNPYYQYNRLEHRWEQRIGKSKIHDSIIENANTIVRALGYDTRRREYSEQRIIREVVKKLRMENDTSRDMLETFSQNFPHWVQFGDLIYDLKHHKVAKAQPFFKLKHYHNYRIPTGLTDDEINDLPIDNTLDHIGFDEGLHKDILNSTLERDKMLQSKIEALFVDCKVSREQMYQSSEIIINRLKENFHEDDIEFILTTVGNLFYHTNDFVMTLFIQGEAGIGKSQFFNFVSDELIGEQNASALKQKQFDSDSRFTETGLYGKEFNLIGELRGKVLSTPLVEVIKSTLSDGTELEIKGGEMKKEKFYSKIVAIGNKGQLPSIPTDISSDKGLRRRLVLMECLPDTKSNNLADTYPMHKLNAVKQVFALLCMMTFNYHLQNGDINTFARNFGCTVKSIDGFTSERLVNTTQNYFQSHDRYRKFFCSLPDTFREQQMNEFIKNDEIQFKRWLYDLTVAKVKQYFIEWYSEEYPRTNMTKEKFMNHLKNSYDIEPLGSYKGLTTNKRIRGLGEPFINVVTKICKEDEPHNYFSKQDDNNNYSKR